MSVPAESPSTVLVTGGSGYVGAWCAARLLQAGYRVRATLRSLARADEVRAMIARETDPAGLSFCAANLTDDAGWGEAAEGCRFALHVASPMSPADIPGPQAIAVARDGALRVLRASAAAGVERVVMTSSNAASRPPAGQATADESTWTEIQPDPSNGFEIYAQSKTLAERAAWDFVAGLGGRMQLTTLLPVMIEGPVLGRDYALSVELIAEMMRGRAPQYPTAGIQMVDVRDLADLHVTALTAPAAAGERFIATAEYMTFAEAARILREHFGDRLPIPTLPTPTEGGASSISGKALDRLGWRGRPIRETLIDTAESLLREGAVQG